MLGFLKKIVGLPTSEEIAAAKAKTVEVPYKLEKPMVNNKTGDLVDEPVVKPTVSDQTTDTVALVKKARKPRTPKAEKTVKETTAKEKVVKEKAAKARRPAAEKAPKRLKKA